MWPRSSSLRRRNRGDTWVPPYKRKKTMGVSAPANLPAEHDGEGAEEQSTRRPEAWRQRTGPSRASRGPAEARRASVVTGGKDIRRRLRRRGPARYPSRPADAPVAASDACATPLSGGGDRFPLTLPPGRDILWDVAPAGASPSGLPRRSLGEDGKVLSCKSLSKLRGKRFAKSAGFSASSAPGTPRA